MNPLENNCGHTMPDNEKYSYLSKKDDFKVFETLILNLNSDGTVTNTLEKMLRFK